MKTHGAQLKGDSPIGLDQIFKREFVLTFRARPGKVRDDEYADKEGTEENGNIECLENVIIIDSDSRRRRLCRITSRSVVVNQMMMMKKKI